MSGMTVDEHLARTIAFAGYRNINLGNARSFESLGIDRDSFFDMSASALSHLTGVAADYFNDERRRKALDAGRREALFVKSNNINVHYYSDEEYPYRLSECDDLPALLYSLGDVHPSAAHVVSIVGTRHSTVYGAEFTRRLVEDLAAMVDDLVIVSGLAYGIDIAAHRAALSCGVPTGAVFAHSLNTVYPAAHRDEARRIVKAGGFLITEYNSEATLHKGNFLARNRIVAAMSDATVVVESDIHGGAMTTARLASAYNRNVFALPGRVSDTYSRGCNALIFNNEAQLIRDAADIVAVMGWKTKAQPGTQNELPLLEGDKALIVKCLGEHPDMTVNDMTVALGIGLRDLQNLLFELEMDEIITRVPGGRYAVLTAV